MKYSLTYTVNASSKMEAIAKATALVRSGVHVRGINSTTEVAPGLWTVSLNLEEDV